MACPACGSGEGEVFFRLAPVPVICNQLFASRAAALAAPRGEIALWHCPACELIHNAAFEPARVRYTGTYENALHFSPRFRAYAEGLARELIERHGVRDTRVVEIGCGDGAFLALLCQLGSNQGLGFDEAYDPARGGPLPAGVTVLARPFADGDASWQPRLICCRQVLEHVADPRTFLARVRRLAGERADAVVFFEVPNVRATLEELGIWDVLYEHCSYFGATALDRLFRAAGFRPLAVRETYGAQFLTIEAEMAADALAPPVAPPDGGPGGLRPLAAAFAARHAQVLDRWRDILAAAARDGARPVLWGGGTKGVMFLNVLGISDAAIAHVVDINPRKQGCHVAGTGQTIISPARLAEIRPRLVIVLNPLYGQEVEAELERLRVRATVLIA